jgi:hypothetical protein
MTKIWMKQPGNIIPQRDEKKDVRVSFKEDTSATLFAVSSSSVSVVVKIPGAVPEGVQEVHH